MVVFPGWGETILSSQAVLRLLTEHRSNDGNTNNHVVAPLGSLTGFWIIIIIMMMMMMMMMFIWGLLSAKQDARCCPQCFILVLTSTLWKRHHHYLQFIGNWNTGDVKWCVKFTFNYSEFKPRLYDGQIYAFNHFISACYVPGIFN